MVAKLLHTRATFFDTNSIGKIMTRFSKDLVIFDSILPQRFGILSIGVFRIFSVLILIGYINPWVLIPIVLFMIIVIVFSLKLQPILIDSFKQDSISREDINHGLLTLTSGITTIRVYD